MVILDKDIDNCNYIHTTFIDHESKPYIYNILFYDIHAYFSLISLVDLILKNNMLKD